MFTQISRTCLERVDEWRQFKWTVHWSWCLTHKWLSDFVATARIVMLCNLKLKFKKLSTIIQPTIISRLPFSPFQLRYAHHFWYPTLRFKIERSNYHHIVASGDLVKRHYSTDHKNSPTYWHKGMQSCIPPLASEEADNWSRRKGDHHTSLSTTANYYIGNQWLM